MNCPVCDRRMRMGFRFRFYAWDRAALSRSWSLVNIMKSSDGPDALEPVSDPTIKEGEVCSEECFAAACSVAEFIRDVGRRLVENRYAQSAIVTTQLDEARDIDMQMRINGMSSAYESHDMEHGLKYAQRVSA